MINPFGLTKTEIKIFEMGETSGWSMGAKSERKRIIKLLEEWPICKEGCYCLPCELGETDALRKEFAELAALIKGENK